MMLNVALHNMQLFNSKYVNFIKIVNVFITYINVF